MVIDFPAPGYANAAAQTRSVPMTESGDHDDRSGENRPPGLNHIKALLANLKRFEADAQMAIPDLSGLRVPAAFSRRDTVEAFEGWVRNNREMFRSFRRAAEQAGRDTGHFATIMSEMGWPPPVDLSIPAVRRIARLDREGSLDREQLSRELVAAYDADHLRNLAESWRRRSWLSDRLPILEEAIEAHIEERYELSVPALLPQVDGLLGDAFGHEGKLYGSELEGYIDELLGQGRAGGLHDAVRAFWIDRVREDSPLGSSIPELSRHAILHGVDTGYGESSKSLRVILLFDLVQDSIQYVATRNGTRYHSPGCYQLGPPRTGNRKVFISYRAVQDQGGLSPCQTCIASVGGENV